MILNIFGKQSNPRPTLFTNTWIGKTDRVSFSYLFYRWSVAVLVMTGLIQSIVQNTEYFLNHQQSENVYKYFIYLTNNGRLVAALGFSLEAILVTQRLIRERRQSPETHDSRSEAFVSRDENSPELPRSHRVLWVFSNITYSLELVITLVYWITLYNPERHLLDFENFSGHGMISGLCLLDLGISARPWRLRHAAHPVMFGAVFGVFSLVYHLAGGTNYFHEPYIYPILDWSQPVRTILVMLSTTLALVIFHCMFFVLYKIRTIILEKCRVKEETKDHQQEKNTSFYP